MSAAKQPFTEKLAPVLVERSAGLARRVEGVARPSHECDLTQREIADDAGGLLAGDVCGDAKSLPERY